MLSDQEHFDATGSTPKDQLALIFGLAANEVRSQKLPVCEDGSLVGLPLRTYRDGSSGRTHPGDEFLYLSHV